MEWGYSFGMRLYLLKGSVINGETIGKQIWQHVSKTLKIYEPFHLFYCVLNSGNLVSEKNSKYRKIC